MAEALALLLTSGSATAAVGSAAGLTTALSTGSAAVGALSSLGAASYNAQVARNNAQISEDNAQRAINEAQIAAQEQDVQARGDIGYFLSRAGASGLAVGSGSIAGQRRSLEELASKDRGLIRHEGDVRAARERQGAADSRAEASLATSAGFFDLVSGGLDIRASRISGASRINRRKAGAITRRPLNVKPKVTKKVRPRVAIPGRPF